MAGWHVSWFVAAASAALVASVWQGLLLAGCVALCLRVIPGVGAAARSAVWLAVFLLVGVLDSVGGARGFTAHGDGGLHVDFRWAFVLAAVWLGMSTVRIVRLACGAVRLASIARRAVPLPAMMACVPGRKTALICSSTEVERPGVVGFFAPRILLPAGLCERLSAAELEAVVLHEREHLRRGDDWTNLLQQVGLALMPLNPVLAWVERQLCRERELACDDSVLRQTKAHKAYAACLAHLAEEAMLRKPLALTLGLAGHGSELGRRIQRILAKPEDVLGRRAAAGVSGVLIAGMLAGGIALARCPQVVSFVPREIAVASVPGMQVHSSGSFVAERGVGRARPVMTVASMDTPAFPGQALPSVSAIKSLRVLKANTSRANRRRRASGWILMTGWSVDGGVQPVAVPLGLTVPVTYKTSSYAAVPVANGWLVFQL